MNEKLKPGMRNEQTVEVDRARVVTFLGETVTPVYATPAMIRDMEDTSRHLLLPHLEPGQDSVGTKVNVAHKAAAPIGSRVKVRAELVELDRRRCLLDVTADWNDVRVGEGTHERFIIDVAKFAAKLPKPP